MGGHTGVTTITDGVAHVGSCNRSTGDAGHAGGDVPAATGGSIVEAAENPEGGGDVGAGSVGGTTTKPPQAHPSCLEPRKWPAQAISCEATPPFNVEV